MPLMDMQKRLIGCIEHTSSLQTELRLQLLPKGWRPRESGLAAGQQSAVQELHKLLDSLQSFQGQASGEEPDAQPVPGVAEQRPQQVTIELEFDDEVGEGQQPTTPAQPCMPSPQAQSGQQHRAYGEDRLQRQIPQEQNTASVNFSQMPGGFPAASQQGGPAAAKTSKPWEAYTKQSRLQPPNKSASQAVGAVLWSSPLKSKQSAASQHPRSTSGTNAILNKLGIGVGAGASQPAPSSSGTSRGRGKRGSKPATSPPQNARKRQKAEGGMSQPAWLQAHKPRITPAGIQIAAASTMQQLQSQLKPACALESAASFLSPITSKNTPGKVHTILHPLHPVKGVFWPSF